MIGEESWSVRTKELLAEEIKAIEEERVTIARSKTLWIRKHSQTGKDHLMRIQKRKASSYEILEKKGMTVEKFITRRSEYKKHNYENGEANPLFFSHLASKAVSKQQQRGEGPANTLAIMLVK